MELIQKELADAIGISTRQVRNLTNQGVFEFVSGKKKYNLAAAVQEYIAFKINAETKRGTNVNKEQEQAEHERVKKEISKIKLRKLRREVHEAEDVETFLMSMLLNFRSRILMIPTKIAPEMLGENDINVIINKLNEELLDVLDKLSEYDPEKISGEDLDDEEDEEDDNNEEE